MLACFENFIGINNVCSPVAPTSGLYLNQLPGMTIKVAQKIMTSENESAVTFLNECIDFGLRETIEDVRKAAYPYIRMNSVIENNTVGYWKDDLVPVALEAGKYKGIRIRIDEYPYLSFNLSAIWLQLDASVTTNIKIFDLISGTQLGSDIPITTVANKPTRVVVNLKFPTNKQRLHLFIAYDSSVAGTFQTLIGQGIAGDCYSCGQIPKGYCDDYCYFYGGKIDQGDAKISTNIEAISGSGGMSLDYSLSCNPENFICNISNAIALPALYRIGAQIMLEAKLNTERLNSLVTIHSATVDIQYSYYLERYNEMMYGQRVSDENNVRDKSGIIRSLKFPDDICFICSEPAQIATLMP